MLPSRSVLRGRPMADTSILVPPVMFTADASEVASIFCSRHHCLFVGVLPHSLGTFVRSRPPNTDRFCSGLTCPVMLLLCVGFGGNARYGQLTWGYDTVGNFSADWRSSGDCGWSSGTKLPHCFCTKLSEKRFTMKEYPGGNTGGWVYAPVLSFFRWRCRWWQKEGTDTPRRCFLLLEQRLLSTDWGLMHIRCK